MLGRFPSVRVVLWSAAVGVSLGAIAVLVLLPRHLVDMAFSAEPVVTAGAGVVAAPQPISSKSTEGSCHGSVWSLLGGDCRWAKARRHRHPRVIAADTPSQAALERQPDSTAVVAIPAESADPVSIQPKAGSVAKLGKKQARNDKRGRHKRNREIEWGSAYADTSWRREPTSKDSDGHNELRTRRVMEQGLLTAQRYPRPSSGRSACDPWRPSSKCPGN